MCYGLFETKYGGGSSLIMIEMITTRHDQLVEGGSAVSWTKIPQRGLALFLL